MEQIFTTSDGEQFEMVDDDVLLSNWAGRIDTQSQIFTTSDGEQFELADDDILLSDWDDLGAAISHANREQYWPNIWHINERGNVDLLSVNFDTGEYSILHSWV